MFVERDLKLQLFGSDSSVLNGKFLMDELHCKYWVMLIRWNCFLNANSVNNKNKSSNGSGRTLPRIGSLTDGLRDDPKWEFAG